MQTVYCYKQIDSFISYVVSEQKKVFWFYVDLFSYCYRQNMSVKFWKKMSPKTCDLDPIPTLLLLECVDIAPVLTDIVNDCFLQILCQIR